jgi:hypothetical protein
MFRKLIGFLIILGSATTLPYAVSHWRDISAKLWSVVSTTSGESIPAENVSRLETKDFLKNLEPESDTLEGTVAQAEKIWQESNEAARSAVAKQITDRVQSATQPAESNPRAVEAERPSGSFAANNSSEPPPPHTAPSAPVYTASNTKKSSNSETPKIDDQPAQGTSPFDLSLVRLDEAVNWDATIPWILQRWPRVNTSIKDTSGKLRGFRVPLVTGANEDDLAGALTYYFNKDNRCTYLTLNGTVGDPRQLVYYLVQRYKFAPKQSTEPGVHIYELGWNGNGKSTLTIKPAQVVRSSTPHLRYQIELEMNRN